MEFDSKRFLKLAGLPDNEPSAVERPSPRALTESARRAPVMSADEQKLRSLIRKEAQRMLGERTSRSASSNLAGPRQKKSLTEAITMGFAGFGFGGKSPVLGGPMTSASRFASLYEADGVEDEEGTLGEADELDEMDELDETDDMSERDQSWEGSTDDEDDMMRRGG